MKNQSRLLLAILGSSLLFSCTTYRLNTRTNKTKDIVVNNIYTMPLISELKVDLTKKIAGVSSGQIKGPYTEDYYKQLALSEALKGSGADLLVDPVYEIKKTIPGFGITSVEITVTGYAAKYENIRSVVEADIKWLELFNLMNNNNTNVQEVKPVIQSSGFLFKKAY